MVRLLVPTRDRPEGVRALLSFIERFSPGLGVVLADGSSPENQEKVGAICQSFTGRLEIEFRPYPVTLPLFERLHDAVSTLPDQCLALGADDDFPMAETYAEAERVLLADPELASVVPCDVLISHDAKRGFAARLAISRPLAQDAPLDRVREFIKVSFPTSYAVARRCVMIDRYRLLADCYCAGFIDFQVGVVDALHGKIAALDAIGSFRTHLEKGGHLRPVEPLIFIRRAETVLQFRDAMASRFGRIAPDDEAQALANEAIERRVLELIEGRRWVSKDGLWLRRNDKSVSAQARMFNDLFTAGTVAREKYFPVLRHVVDHAVARVAAQDDEPVQPNYETF